MPTCGGGGGALGHGGQALVFGHVDGVGGPHDVELVVGLFGQSGGLSSLEGERGQRLAAAHCPPTTLPFGLR